MGLFSKILKSPLKLHKKAAKKGLKLHKKAAKTALKVAKNTTPGLKKGPRLAVSGQGNARRAIAKNAKYRKK